MYLRRSSRIVAATRVQLELPELLAVQAGQRTDAEVLDCSYGGRDLSNQSGDLRLIRAGQRSPDIESGHILRLFGAGALPRGCARGLSPKRRCSQPSPAMISYERSRALWS